uniref:nuclear transport factor 2 family protein n=1 Tax=Rhizobium sp. F40D2 TaxID=3453141 RepID=UPI003F26CDC8
MDGDGRLSCAGTYVGPQEGLRHVFQALGEAFDDYTFKLERLLHAGDDVIAIGDYSGTHRQTGKSFKARVVHAWRVADGKIRRFEQFTDTLRVAESMR